MVNVKRMGRFCVGLHFLKCSEDGLLLNQKLVDIFRGMVVISANVDLTRDRIEYGAIGPMFDVVKEGCIVPMYECRHNGDVVEYIRCP